MRLEVCKNVEGSGDVGMVGGDEEVGTYFRAVLFSISSWWYLG